MCNSDFLEGLAGEVCEKAAGDILAVEKVKALVGMRARRYWLNKISAAITYLESELLLYHDNMGHDAVDSLVIGGTPRRDLEIAALLATLEERLGCPLSAQDSHFVETEADKLLLSGALALGTVPTIRGPRTTMTARRHLHLLLAGRLTPDRRREIGVALEEYLTSRPLRDALRAGQRTADQQALLTAWKSKVSGPLGARWATWGPQTVDVWAYKWENVGRILTGEQNGVKKWKVLTVQDSRRTKFCSWLEGRIVPLSWIREKLQVTFEAITAGDVAALRSAGPLELPGSPAGYAEHFRAVVVPPFHWNCRSVLVPA